MLKGKIALVTGAASGIGLTASKIFAQQSASVIMVDLNETVKSIVNDDLPQKDGASHSAFVCDVSKSDQVNNMLNFIQQQYPSKVPNIVVNSAGIQKHELFFELSEETFDRVISVNLKGTYLVTQAVVKALIKKYDSVTLSPSETYASIINISSVAAKHGQEYGSHYCASKGGIEAMTRSIAKELAKYKIRCNCVAPGYIDTPMNNTPLVLDPVFKKTILSVIPMKRPGEAIEVAQTCLFLASDLSSYITGESILCDGGMLS